MLNSINRFNGLTGTTVTRSELVSILNQATDEQNLEIINRISSFLKNNPEAIKITFTEVKKVSEITIDELYGLYLENHEDGTLGLGRAVSADEIYNLVTNLMLDTIKEVGHLPWQKEWVGSGITNAMNYVTGKSYSGINYILLNFSSSTLVNGKRVLKISDKKSPYYLTFNQIEQLGGTLKKGSKGTEVVYYNFIFNYRDDKHKYSTVDATALEKFVKQNGITKEEIESHLYKVPLLKYYKVFSFDDCEGIKEKKPSVRKIEPIQVAENIISFYPDKPKYEFGTDKAFYTPSTDVVSMPKINAFSSEANYYTTFFHEIVHSTGHPKRLARDFSGRFGNEKYAYEELIAELGAVYLSSEAGMLFHTRNNSAKYLRGWNARLVKKMEDDNRFFMRAAAEAQKAVNLILDNKKHLEIVVSNGQKKAKDLEKVNPKPFAIKPKSVSVQMAIKDVLSLPKFKGISTLIASIIYKKFNDKEFVLDSALFSNYELSILKNDSSFHINFTDEIELLDLGQDFIKAVNGRLESLKKQKHNYAMFDGLKGSFTVPQEPLLADVLAFAEKNLYGKSVYHRDIGKKIHFSKSGIKKALYGKRGVSKIRLQLVYVAKKILQSSRLINIEKDNKDRNKVLNIYKLNCFHTINGQEYRLFIVIRETANGVLYYDHEGIKIKKHVQQTGGDKSKSTPLSTSNVLSENKDTKKPKTTKKKGKLSVPVIVQTISHDVSPVIPVVLNQPEIAEPEENLLIPATEEKKENNPPFEQPPVVKNKLMSMEFDSLKMDEGWEDLMQHPARNMKIAIWGPPKNGKTAAALQMANYLTKFGKVLYNFADQGFNKSTKDLWIESGLSNNSKAEPNDASTLADLEKEIATGKYDFVFIDMISDYIRMEKIKPEEFKQNFIRKYPNVSFILVFEVTKGGNFKGDQGWTHLVDAIMTVEDFLMENRGRYGFGQRVIWLEGLKQFNPKKYDELISENIQEI